MEVALSIPGSGNINEGPTKIPVPTGGLFPTGQNIFGVLFGVIFLIAIFFTLFTLIRGAIDIIMSQGDKQKFQSARNRIQYAILGLVIIFLSFFAINVISNFVGIKLIGP